MRISTDHARGISGLGLTFLAAAATLAAMTTFPGRSNANELIVKFDQSQIIKLPRPVTEIIIGNPMIADVAIQASNLLVVTGKSFGLTNLIALDADRNVIIDQRVMVQRDNNRLLFLSKGGKRETYNCTPQCNPTITVGDDTAFFNQTAATSERKIRLIEGQTEGGSISSSQ
jgi:hypothetical protein